MTLLELLLALALSVVVLSAVGMAINLYFKMLDVRRTSMEEMQVVRIVTQRITNDFRRHGAAEQARSFGPGNGLSKLDAGRHEANSRGYGRLSAR